jgi:hypothetical protein
VGVADGSQHMHYKGNNHNHFRGHSFTLSVYLMLLYNEAQYNKESAVFIICIFVY